MSAQSGSEMTRRWVSWTGRELDFLDIHQHTLTIAEMARHLGRSYYATEKALGRLRA